MQGKCKICGQASEGVSFADWVKPTFTDFDKLQSGEIVCNACLFFFEEASPELARRMGKDKPQRMRNYSHFVVNGEWTPLSKGNKDKMRELLLGDTFPELAAVADSGQKHVVFRAVRNAPNSKAGWVQFEEQRVFVNPDELRGLLEADASAKRDKARKGNDVEGETGQKQQMRYYVETLAAGSRLYWEISLDDVTDLEREAFFVTLAEFSRFPYIGGKSGVGHGKVSIKFDNWIEIDSRIAPTGKEIAFALGNLYHKHLQERGNEICDLINGLS